MAGTEKNRDWDKEMAEVDRLLKKLPLAEPTLGRGGGGGGGGGEPTVKRPVVSGATAGGTTAMATARDRLGTWTKVSLGVLVAIGVAPGVWPYTHGCGLRLMFYLVGVGAVVAAGLWASISSWRRRLGFAHVVAHVLIVWGAVLLMREVLPRVGAKTDAVWLCPDVAPPR